MLNENAKKWVKALRSGKYLQAKGKLRREEGFCCLGVACELAVEAGVINPATFRNESYYYEDHWNYLPRKVQKWLGLTSNAGSFRESADNSTVLAYKNDQGLTFSQIADIIESEPEDLFYQGDTK